MIRIYSSKDLDATKATQYHCNTVLARMKNIDYHGSDENKIINKCSCLQVWYLNDYELFSNGTSKSAKD